MENTMIKIFGICLIFVSGLLGGFKLGEGSKTIYTSEKSLIEDAIKSNLTVNFRFDNMYFNCEDFETCTVDSTLCFNNPNQYLEYTTYETGNVSVTCINTIGK